MEKKFIINRVDLGHRVVGYEVFNPAANGGEVIGMTVKQLSEGIKAGEVIGMTADMKLDEAKGFHAIMVKTGIGKLTSTDQTSVANLMYTVYKREGENFKVISSRFGRQTFCADKIKALLDLKAVNGVVLDGDMLMCSWEIEDVEAKGKTKK